MDKFLRGRLFNDTVLGLGKSSFLAQSKLDFRSPHFINGFVLKVGFLIKTYNRFPSETRSSPKLQRASCGV